MSMNIRELHGQILSTKIHLVSSGVRGITSNHYQLARPVFAEALIKHPILPKSFGKAFDEIMGEKYGLESVRAGRITRELDLSGTRELMERANLQLALISPDTFQLIQDRLAEKKKNPQRKDIHKDFPLRGFVLCAECKQPMTAAWTQGRSQKYPYYRCRAKGCSMHNKNIAKDTIETQFEEVLAQIKPRENILEVVRIELLAMTHQRTFNVEATRKRRNDRVQQIKADIDIFCNRIKEAHSPAVINAYEEKIEALEAEKLRLGETVKKSEANNFQFEPALNRVVEFIKDPLLMWKTGDLEQQRLVLRMIFDEPLVYDHAKGFYTEEFSPKLSLLLKISCIPCLDEIERRKMVEMPGVEPGSNV